MAAAESLSSALDHERHFTDPLGAVHDPVCGMSVEPATTEYRAQHAGRS